jgi:hypothetical protein
MSGAQGKRRKAEAASPFSTRIATLPVAGVPASFPCRAKAAIGSRNRCNLGHLQRQIFKSDLRP